VYLHVRFYQLHSCRLLCCRNIHRCLSRRDTDSLHQKPSFKGHECAPRLTLYSRHLFEWLLSWAMMFAEDELSPTGINTRYQSSALCDTRSHSSTSCRRIASVVRTIANWKCTDIVGSEIFGAVLTSPRSVAALFFLCLLFRLCFLLILPLLLLL
jgi:hypothetical protein